ncbi:putative transmembrane protein [Cedratvirus kamchatka]|uniref:Transmembrane protein n=1 Tax=Cedratvirus kamchatka TaxID=2716914 RepID=A0A6G8MY55_9VIRU|nr:putative transmembrane protein [Cedratvirus kamchatka]WIL04025.1 putative membrane protein [Cedratvirus lena]WIL04637.1 putative membrane protein [Cedratvirus duvanny]
MALALNILIGVVLIIDLVLIFLAGYLYYSLKSCESRESIFCLQWICPDQTRAVRIHKDEVVESGPYGFIPPVSKEKSRKLTEAEVCR